MPYHSGKWLYFFVSGKAFVADSAVDHDDGDIRLLRYSDEIWPDFLFHQQADCGANISEGTAHYPGEIEGEIEYMEIFTKCVGCTGVAGIGGRADYDFEIREFVLKLFDDGLCGVDLSYADGVEPDALFFGKFACDFTEALVPAGKVAFVPDGPIYDDGAVAYCRQQIYKVN